MSELYIGGQQILPEKPEMVTGYTVNTSFVPVATLNRTQVTKCGKIVAVCFDWHGQVTLTQGNCVVITGLPKPYPINGTIWEAVCKRSDLVNQRCWVDNSGSMTVGASETFNGKMYGMIMYMTRD